MKKWKYLKGAERTFSGADDNCVIASVERSSGAKYFHCSNNPDVDMMNLRSRGHVVTGYRQLIKDDEQDLNDCIGAPEARSCSADELTMKEGKMEIDVSQFLPEGYPLMGHVSCRCHATPLEFGAKGDIPALIAERGSRYGKFKDGADIMQSLKDVMREVDGWNNLTPSQKEALDIIQHKVGRILNGDPNYDDSWKDIAGYATLIANELNGEIK